MDPFCNFLFMCVRCCAVVSIPCSFVITCWKGLTYWLSWLCVFFLCICHFSIRCPGSGVEFDSIPDLCLLLYFAFMPEPWTFSQFVQFGISLYHIASMHGEPNGTCHSYQ